MVSSALNRLAPINFTRYIDRLTERFTGREWLFEQIDGWLQQGNEQFYLLTGEPGVGKSAIAAKLTQIRSDIAAYHFCRAGDVETVRPGRVLRSLAAQLGKTLPHYGEALAKTIDPIRLRIDVNINIESLSNSQVTGIYIENLKESDPRDELEILLRAPLAALPDLYTEHNEPLPTLKILLIDSLDEAVTTTGRDNMATLLAALSQADGLPSWIRFILTARPDLRVLQQFELMKLYKLEELLAQNLKDIERYVQRRVQETIEQPTTFLIFLWKWYWEIQKNQPVDGERLDLWFMSFTYYLITRNQPEFNFQIRLEQAQLSAEMLVHTVKDLSEGNFLYTRLLMDGVGSGELSLKNLSALPKNLNEVYQRFLRHRCPFRKWINRYQPILGTLTVTQEAISHKQLVKFTGIDTEQIQGAISILQQFLDEVENDEGEKLYTIFHQSLREYLLDRKHNQDFWCDAQEHHESVISAYKNNVDSWNDVRWIEVDNYGLLHLIKHLSLQINVAISRNELFKLDQFYESLYAFICKTLMLAKLDRFKSDQPFYEDVKLLIEIAHSTGNLAQVFRGHLISATLSFHASRVTPEFIGFWAISGEIKKAKGYAALLSNSLAWCKAYILIGESLGELGRKQDALKAINEVLSEIRNIEIRNIDDENKRIKLLIKIVHVFSRLQYKEGLRDMLKISSDLGEGITKILPEIAHAQVLLNDIDGIHETFFVLKKTHEDALGGIRSRTLEQMINVLVPYGNHQLLNLILDITKTIFNPTQRMIITKRLASILYEIGDKDSLIKILELDKSLNNFSSFAEISKAFAMLGEIDLANTIIKEGSNIYYSDRFPHADIVNALASKGDLNCAVLEFQKIVDANEKLQALVFIARAVVRLQDTEKMKLIFSEIDKLQFPFLDLDKAKALGSISQALIEVGNVDLAVYCANQVLELVKEKMRPGTSSEYNAADALIEVIPTLVQLEDFAKLSQVQILAEAMIDGTLMEGGLTRGDGKFKGKVLSNLAVAYSHLGKEENMRQVLTIVEAMGHTPKDETLNLISRALMQNNKFSKAIEVATKMRKKYDIEKGGIFSEITQAAIRSGEFYQALTAARAIPHNLVSSINGERVHPEDSLVKVIDAMAQAGEFDWALTEVEEIQDEECWAKAIYMIALSLVRDGEQERAKNIIDKAVRRLKEFNAEDEYYKIESINSIAQALLQIGEIDIAKNIVDKLFEKIKNSQDEYYTSNALAEISYTFAQTGNSQKINSILEICNSAQNMTTRANALSKISMALALVGTEEDLNSKIMSDYWFITYEKYNGSINFLDNFQLQNEVTKFRRLVLEGLIQSLSFIWRNSVSKNPNTNVWTMTSTKTLNFIKYLSLSKDKTTVILNRIVKAIRHFKDEEERLDLLRKLLLAMASGGQGHRTGKILKFIFSDLQLIKGSLFEPEILCDVAQALILLGQTSNASKLANRALLVVETLDHIGWQALYLSRVSQILVQLDERDNIAEIASRVLESAPNRDWGNYSKQGVLYDNNVGWRKEAMARAALALACIGRIDILKQTVAASEKIDDEECRSDILAGIVSSLSLNSPEQLDSIFASIKLFKQERYVTEILAQIAETLAHAQAKDEFDQLLSVVRGMRNKNEKFKVLGRVTKALTSIKAYEEAILIWQERFTPEYLKSPQEVFNLLGEGTSLMARIDQGKALRSLYKTIVEVEEWWEQNY